MALSLQRSMHYLCKVVVQECFSVPLVHAVDRREGGG